MNDISTSTAKKNICGLNDAQNLVESDIAYSKKKTGPRKQAKPKYFLNDEAQSLKRDFLEAQHRFELTGSTTDKTQMTTRKRAYDLKLRDIKRQHIVTYINQAYDKSKATWKVINDEKTGKNDNKPKLELLADGKNLEDPQEIADFLNEYVTNIADNTLRKQRNDFTTPELPTLTPITNSKLDELHPTSLEEVQNVIKSLKSTHSADQEGLAQTGTETDKIFELDTTHDIKFLEPTNATSSLLKNQTHVENETDLPTNSIQELEQSLLANDPKNNEDSLIMAAKIGSVLLEENKSLKEEKNKLTAQVINMEAKIEDLLSCEETYIRRTEQLQQQLAEMELQRIKDREHILEIQQIFEDNDKKQVVQLN
ncbi:hypothetical protein J6590_067674 [Homalodisca vitripennis]|nr:hypothetical protein J6590_067674 [Homalodisca vitripennis]